jgi:hypothetical protein
MKPSVKVATSPGAPASERLSIALLVPAHPTETHSPDIGMTLVELFAYVADVLTYYQDRAASEAYLDTARDRNTVRIRVPGARPAGCLIANNRSAYLILVGPSTHAAEVGFAVSTLRGRLPKSSAKVSVTYGETDADGGYLIIRGLDLHEPFAVIVIMDPRSPSPALFRVWPPPGAAPQ